MSSDLEGDLNQDGIIDEMDRVRGDLDGQINELGASMRNMFDWQAYVRSAPLASVGAALVVGYLLAPAVISRSAPAPAPAGSAGSSKTGITQSLVGMLVAGVARAGTAYIAEMLAHNLSTPEDSPAATAENRPPFDMGV